MSKLTLGERLRIARLSMVRASRSAVTGALRSPVLGWSNRPAHADELLLVPPDLRTPDPSFLEEMASGQIGLAGATVDFGPRSPFHVVSPSRSFARELNGFGWLRHLAAAGGAEAEYLAQRTLSQWIEMHKSRTGIAWEPDVVARRIMSWVSHAGLLLEHAEPTEYRSTTRSLAEQIRHLDASWRDAPDGYPRLVALVALMVASLCIAGSRRKQHRTEQCFLSELGHQILPDGGHVSRNPATVVELLLDLLPLRQSYAARGRAPPAAFLEAVQRMIAFLRYMRLGDGALARFNGMGSTPADALATVLSYDERPTVALAAAPQSGYLRLTQGSTVILMDAGAPPPLELAGSAHAGTLSFEMSSAGAPLLINGGAPAQGHEVARARARATSSHNTLAVNGKSSARIIRHAALVRHMGAEPIRGPDRVTARTAEEGGEVRAEATHDGYLGRFGVLHSRWLALSADGGRLEGEDRLGPPSGVLRIVRDLPFAIHFHLHRSVACRLGEEPVSAVLTAPDGTQWRFHASGARLSIEESLDYTPASGPVRHLQIVLRAATFGESTVTWSLVRA